MNEAKEVTKDRAKRVTRKDSRLTAIGVWALVLIELVRYALPYAQPYLGV